jgi:hypothetical protein
VRWRRRSGAEFGKKVSNQADTEFHEVRTKFHEEKKSMALRAAVFASFARSAINPSLRETSCALRETLCPLDYFLAAQRPNQIDTAT